MMSVTLRNLVTLVTYQYTHCKSPSLKALTVVVTRNVKYLAWVLALFFGYENLKTT
jgi:hypothetical protein